jgi:hypothetical protein
LKRPLAFSFITGALALSMSVGVSVAPAQAATAPAPINVPGSVLAGGYGTNSTATLSKLASISSNFSPAVVAASVAKTAGTATASQLTILNEAAALSKVPWTRLAPLLKTVGAVTLPFASYAAGSQIGNGVAQFFGVSDDGAVCAADNYLGLVGFVAGVDCGQFAAFSTSYVPNFGTVGDQSCSNYPSYTMPPPSSVVLCNGTIEAYGKKGYPGMDSSFDGTLAHNVEYTFTITDNPGTTPDSMTYSYTITNAVDFWSGYINEHNVGTSWNFSRWCSKTDLTGLSQGSFGQSNTFKDGSWTKANGYTLSGSRTCPSSAPELLAITVANFNPPSNYPEYPGGWGYFYTKTPSETPSANPERVLNCVIQGSDGINYSESSLPFFEADGVLPPVLCPTLPPEVAPATLKIVQVSDTETHELLSEEATPEFDAAATLAPECLDGTCLLDLRKNAVSCFSSGDCSDWFTDPDKLTVFSCYYGTHVMDLAECNVYSQTFNLVARSTGQIYADPISGTAYVSDVAVGVDADVFSAPVLDPLLERQCFPTGWGALNPVEWVTKPVQCALQWAFIPQPAVLTETMMSMSTRWESKAPAQLAGVIGSWAFEAPASGCEGVLVPLSVIQGVPDFYILNACPGSSLEPLAVTSSLVIGIASVIGAVGAVTRNFGGIVGYVGVKD